MPPPFGDKAEAMHLPLGDREEAMYLPLANREEPELPPVSDRMDGVRTPPDEAPLSAGTGTELHLGAGDDAELGGASSVDVEEPRPLILAVVGELGRDSEDGDPATQGSSQVCIVM